MNAKPLLFSGECRTSVRGMRGPNVDQKREYLRAGERPALSMSARVGGVDGHAASRYQARPAPRGLHMKTNVATDAHNACRG